MGNDDSEVRFRVDLTGGRKPSPLSQRLGRGKRIRRAIEEGVREGLDEALRQREESKRNKTYLLPDGSIVSQSTYNDLQRVLAEARREAPRRIENMLQRMDEEDRRRETEETNRQVLAALRDVASAVGSVGGTGAKTQEPSASPKETVGNRHRGGFTNDEKALALLEYEMKRGNRECLRWTKSHWENEIGCGKRGLTPARAPAFNARVKELRSEHGVGRGTAEQDHPGKLDGGVQ